MAMTLTLFMVTVANTNSFAQKADKYDECKIKVSATCNGCKTKIEKNIAFEKGIKDINVDLKTKIATIKYKKDKNNPDNLLKAVEKLGYNAEIVKSKNNTIKNSKKCNELVPCRKKSCKEKKG